MRSLIFKENLFRWSLLFLLLPFLIDLALLPFAIQAPGIAGAENQEVVAHVVYPDMAPEVVINTFQNGVITELFFLNIHNIAWKYLGFFPSGRYFTLLGIFLLGYYLASIGFFTEKTKSTFLLISGLIIGLLATISAKILGGSPYQFPPTLANILFKFLSIAGQIFMCFFYILSVFKIAQTSWGKRLLSHLIPVGRMALTNYLFQTALMILIFYNFGFNLIG